MEIRISYDDEPKDKGLQGLQGGMHPWIETVEFGTLRRERMRSGKKKSKTIFDRVPANGRQADEGM